jgi:hypothetical protein
MSRIAGELTSIRPRRFAPRVGQRARRLLGLDDPIAFVSNLSGDGFERCFWLHHCSATVTSRVDLNMETGEMTGSAKGTLSP